MNFNNIVDQIFLFLILIALVASLVIPVNQYMKDRKGYPLFQVLATCFYLNSAFVAFITLVSFVRSTLTLNSFDKAFNALISFQIPAGLFGFMAVTLLIIAVGLQMGFARHSY